MIAKADILRVMEWMGHAAVQTTRGYLHSLGLARADRGEPVIAPAD